MPTISSSMNFRTTHSYSLTLDALREIQSARRQCCKRLEKRLLTVPLLTGRQTLSKRTNHRWQRQWLYQKDLFGPITDRPTLRSVATSKLSSRSQSAPMDTTHATNCLQMLMLRVMKTMSWPWEPPRLPRISPATMDSSPKPISTLKLSTKLQLLVLETQLSSKTSSRTIKWRCQAFRVTNQWMLLTKRASSDPTASWPTENISLERRASFVKSKTLTH